MAESPVLVHVEGGVALVTLNNPPLNLVTLEMTRVLTQELERLAADRSVRVLILTGSGERAFCAGSDLREFPEMMGAGRVVPEKLAPENAAFSMIDDFPRPTIAAVTGLAYGGGLEMAVSCDLVVVEEGCRLSLPEIKLGVFPGSGGTVRVTRRIGEGRAKEMMFFGDPIDADTALAWGLVNRVAPRGASLETARGLAAVLAQRPGRALGLCKAAIDDSFDMTEDDAIRRSLVLSAEAFESADCREGVRAFFAKEHPRFSHR